jgi:hypothetical protein
MPNTKVTLAAVATALTVAAFAATPLAHAGLGIPQKPAVAATLEPGASAADLPAGPTVGSADLPPGPNAVGPEV